jgi:hypothetical protein
VIAPQLRATNASLATMYTWTARELVVLRTLVEKFEDVATYHVRIESLPAATGLEKTEIQRALRSLNTADPPYLKDIAPSQLGYPIIITGVTERTGARESVPSNVTPLLCRQSARDEDDASAVPKTATSSAQSSSLG